MRLLVVAAVIATSVAFALAGMPGCMPSSVEAVRDAEAFGFHDVTVADTTALFAGFYGCGEHDQFAYRAAATNANGQRVKIVVCRGLWFKAATVRVL